MWPFSIGRAITPIVLGGEAARNRARPAAVEQPFVRRAAVC